MHHTMNNRKYKEIKVYVESRVLMMKENEYIDFTDYRGVVRLNIPWNLLKLHNCTTAI